MKLSQLEQKIFDKEVEEIQSEFDRAMEIIKNTIDRYGKEFHFNEEGQISIFRSTYKLGKDVLSKPKLDFLQMPNSFKRTVKDIAIENFMNNISEMKDVFDNLE